jgi:hypothetical protein
MGGVVRAHMWKCLAATVVAFALFSLQPGPASAQAQAPAQEGDRVRGDIAGTVGLGLLGAEVGLLLTPAFNLQDHWWAWALFPTVGAAGGVVAGIFAFEPRSPEPAVTISILGAGLLLAVPAVVTASALSSARGTRLGVPAVSTAPVFTAAEQARFGLPQRNSTRLALLSGSF